MRSRMRRTPALVPVTLAVVMGAGLVSCSSDSQDATAKTAKEFLDAWQAGDLAKASAVTDDPEKAKKELGDVAKQLGLVKLETQQGGTNKKNGDTPASLSYRATVTVQGIADPVSWDSAVPVVKKDGKSVVKWSTTVVHPQLTENAKFSNQRTLPERAAILDRNGKPLSETQPVVSIFLWPAKMTEPEKVYTALADPIFQVDVAKLRDRVAKSPPDNRVSVVTLREPVYNQARPKIANLPGFIIDRGTTQVAVAAQQLVGKVGEANADTLKNAGPAAAAGDVVGVSGLQYRYQKELAGSPAVKLTIVDANKAVKATLVDVPAKPGAPLKTGIDPRLQANAEQAIATVKNKNAAIVAIKPSTGEIVAAANNPPEGTNRALSGRYPPGSTFKIVTATALLSNGIKATDVLPCPTQLVVNGQKFENQDALGAIEGNPTLMLDFAKSCNTAFIGERGRLKDDTLTQTAQAFGIGAEWQVGASSFDGSVPAAKSENEKAAAMIGQGKVEASPMVMASVAATAQSGVFRQPYLVDDPARPRHQATAKLDPNVVQQLQAMMRETVKSGTAAGLSGVPGNVGAKTGTAEFGTGPTPGLHAWLVAYKDDLAVAVLIEDGGKNSPKVDVMRQFLMAS